jgi:hypothetical protein
MLGFANRDSGGRMAWLLVATLLLKKLADNSRL